MLAKKFGFGVGIAIVLPLLVHYGVSTFSPQPRWQDYNQNYYYSQDYQEATPEEKKRLREERQKKDDAYKEHRKVFERHLFYVATPVGIAAIMIGALIGVQAVGAGLIFGGIFTITEGYCIYWSELENWMRFLSLLVAFTILIVIGYLKETQGIQDRGNSS